jgi:hypothetical protein
MELDPAIRHALVLKFVAGQPEQVLLAYVQVGIANWVKYVPAEASRRRVLLAAVNVVNCMGHANEIESKSQSDPAKRKSKNMTSCESCVKSAQHHNFTYFAKKAGTLLLCIDCFNADRAAQAGIYNFDNHPLDPISIVRVDGASHTVYFKTRLLGAMAPFGVFELIGDEPSGYRFQLTGETGEDRYAQFGRQVQKIRATLATMHF